jgi:hypothetical protein
MLQKVEKQKVESNKTLQKAEKGGKLRYSIWGKSARIRIRLGMRGREVHSYGGWGVIEGWVWPMGQTQPSVSIIYMCMLIYFNPPGFFLVHSVKEEIAEMKGYSRLG